MYLQMTPFLPDEVLDSWQTARKANCPQGTPTKCQVSKCQVSKRLVSKHSVSKCQVYKMSCLQNVRFQNVVEGRTYFEVIQTLNS